jgi:hypothetical protein
MATSSVSGIKFSEPHTGASAAEIGGLGELDSDLCSAAMAMDLRQSLQVIVSAHDVLARSIRGRAMRAQLTLIEKAAMRLAGAVDQLVEVLRFQEALTPDKPAPRSAPKAASIAPAAGRRDGLTGVRVTNQAFARPPAARARREEPLQL